MVTQPCPGRTRDTSTIDISSVLSDSGLTGPLGKAPSKRKRPRCKVVTEVLDLGHVQGTWLILPCASVFEIQGLILLQHSGPEQPAVLQIQVNSLNLRSKCSGVEGKKRNKGQGKNKCAIVLLLIITSYGLALFLTTKTKVTGYKGLD